MKTKVTLTIEKEILKRVKQYAKEHNVSVSSIVEEHFKKLINPEEAIETNLMEFVDKLKPIIEVPEDFDWKKEYYKDRAKKYGF